MQKIYKSSFEERLIKLAYRIPIFGPWLKHANAYVWQGSGEYTQKLAPLSKWMNSIVSDVIFAAFLALTIEATVCQFSLTRIEYGELISEFFPSFIGFAIGVYALTYILPSTVSKESLTSGRKRYEALPSNLGYPIITIICMLLLSVLVDSFDLSKLTSSIQAFFLIYGFILVIEITSLVTTIGRAQVSQRLRAANQKDNQ
jgi:hypothetical protein